MAGTFDFCDTARVIKELPPETPAATDMNGWEFTARPNVPYRRSFRVKLYGMYWYTNPTSLDVTTNPKFNAGRLLDFYRANQTWDVFALNHQYLGNILCRFKTAVDIPEAIEDSFGLIAPFEVSLIHYNPSYT